MTALHQELGSHIRPGFKQSPGFLDPWDAEDWADEEPITIRLPAEYFVVYRNRKPHFVYGQVPPELEHLDVIHARTWRRYQALLEQTPVWERAEGYRQLMEQEGLGSIRALARRTGEDHSRVARVLKVLELPEPVLDALRQHSTDTRIRAHFTEKRLRQMAQTHTEADILGEIDRVLQPPA